MCPYAPGNWRAADRGSAQHLLRLWQQDNDLAGIRDATALDKLPAEERTACEKLWADVAALLKKAEEREMIVVGEALHAGPK
jgi:hypothetical protein